MDQPQSAEQLQSAASDETTLKVKISDFQGEVVLSEEYSRTQTVLNVKKRVQEACGCSADSAMLVWNSVILQPNHAELGTLVGEEHQDISVTVVKLDVRRVYFEGISWAGGGGRPDVRLNPKRTFGQDRFERT